MSGTLPLASAKAWQALSSFPLPEPLESPQPPRHDSGQYDPDNLTPHADDATGGSYRRRLRVNSPVPGMLTLRVRRPLADREYRRPGTPTEAPRPLRVRVRRSSPPRRLLDRRSCQPLIRTRFRRCHGRGGRHSPAVRDGSVRRPRRGLPCSWRRRPKRLGPSSRGSSPASSQAWPQGWSPAWLLEPQWAAAQSPQAAGSSWPRLRRSGIPLPGPPGPPGRARRRRRQPRQGPGQGPRRPGFPHRGASTSAAR
jgi:hypothetical protein